MKIKHVKVDVYKWKIDVIELSSKDTFDDVQKVIQKYKLDKEIIATIKKEMEENCKDGGYTFTKCGRRQSIIFLYKISNKKIRRSILNHEKRHVEDDIVEYLGINDKEAVAYLAGYLSENIY